jgi:hypothetical protein
MVVQSVARCACCMCHLKLRARSDKWLSQESCSRGSVARHGSHCDSQHALEPAEASEPDAVSNSSSGLRAQA